MSHTDTHPVADQDARLKALDTNSSFAVSAPAGSGKTELLIQRILKLLTQVDAPEQILAITFTRKAAQEMRQRIFAALADAAGPEPEAGVKQQTWQLAQAVVDRDQNLGWGLLLNPNRLRLQTIDGFCFTLAKRTPLAHGFGTELIVSENSEVLYQQAVLGLMDCLEEKSELSEDLAFLLNHLNHEPQRCQDLLVRMLASREQWLGYLLGTPIEAFRQVLESNLESLVIETLEQLSDAISPVADDLQTILTHIQDHNEGFKAGSALTDCLATFAEDSGLPGNDLSDLVAWQGIAELLLTQTGQWRKSFTKVQGIPAGKNSQEKKQVTEVKQLCSQVISRLNDNSQVVRLLTSIQLSPPLQYEEQQWQLLAALSRLLPRLVAELQWVFNEQSEVDYVQVGQAALSALGDEDQPSDQALLLDYQLQHILVDEFQDTSSLQYQLLQRLTAGWQPGDGKTLFIVGDGMQSIYGFRNTKVDLFLAAQRFGLSPQVPMQALDLSVNFRSDPHIVNWVNTAFAAAMPNTEELAHGAVPFSPSSAFHSNNEQAPNAHTQTSLNLFEAPDKENAAGLNTRDRENQAISTLIKELQANDPDTSITILVRDRGALTSLLPCLKQAEISWQATDIDPLQDLGTISDLLALTLSLHNPADRIAWFSILRAPWCGLTLQDMLCISQTLSNNTSIDSVPDLLGQIDAITGLSQDANLALSRLAELISPALAQQGRKPLRQWIEGIWLALGGAACAQSEFELDNSRAFFQLLDQFEQGGRIADLPAFKEAVAKLYALPEQTKDAASEMPVQIMTMHKAKGLEFDHVILPALDRPKRSAEPELLLWYERMDRSGDNHLLLGPISQTGYDQDNLYRFIANERKLRDEYERTRLFYVACTRAIRGLHLFATLAGQAKQDKDTQEELSLPKEPASSSLLGPVWPALADEANWFPLEEANMSRITAEPVVETNTAGNIRRLSTHWQLPPVPEYPDLSAFRGHEYATTSDLDPFDLSFDPKPGLNQVYRQLLAQIARRFSNQDINTLAGNGLPENLIALIEGLLYNQGLYDPAFAEILIKALQLQLSDEHGQWLMNNEHLNIQHNVPLIIQEDEDFKPLWISHSFESEGQNWLIEYDLSDNPSVISQIAADRLSDLARMRDALGAWLEQQNLRTGPIQCLLYFPLLQTSCNPLEN